MCCNAAYPLTMLHSAVHTDFVHYINLTLKFALLHKRCRKCALGEHTGMKTELYQSTSKCMGLSIEPLSSASCID